MVSGDLLKTGQRPSSTDGEIGAWDQRSPLGLVVPSEAGDPTPSTSKKGALEAGGSEQSAHPGGRVAESDQVQSLPQRCFPLLDDSTSWPQSHPNKHISPLSWWHQFMWLGMEQGADPEAGL